MSGVTPPNLFDNEPRADVLDGTLQEDQFAASLSTVVHEPSHAAPMYRDPTAFFELTYPTDGLQTLLTNLAGRFLSSTGSTGDDYANSILCLDTRFGGGKTHDLIAAYHLATTPGEITDLDTHLLDSADGLGTAYQDAAADGLAVETAVFVGAAVDALDAQSDRRDAAAPESKTMWGDIAYQLYGQAGYDHVAAYDRGRNAPGENTLKDLFDLGDGPVLILIDEIAAYLEATASVDAGEATLASQTTAFLLALFNTAAELDDVTVVYSIADSAFSEEAEEARALVDDLNQIGRRRHRTVTPTDETEIGQVLQKRLFESVADDHRTPAAEAYFEVYTDSDRQFPQPTTNASYADRLEREYPFHPTVIDTLTEKIDTIPTFQRTRGALKLLARAIHHLWNDRPDQYDRHWIRLYDLTPADDAPSGSIDATLRESLFEFVDLSSALTADIYSDDGTAHAQLEDRKWTEKGVPALGSHLTTTVLWHSLAYGEQAAGLTRAELNEALAHPEVRFDNYDSALAALGGQDMTVACYYLYDDDRIRFKSDPNLIRIIDQRVENTPDAQARNRFETALDRAIGDGEFTPRRFPESPADLPDELTPQLAVMHMDTAPVTPETEGIPSKVETLYRKAASSHEDDTASRVFKNYVVFLAPDGANVQTAVEEARAVVAIEALLEDSQQTADLSPDQVEELESRQQRKVGLLGELVRKAYSHLYFAGSDGLEHVTVNAATANGGTKLVPAVAETLSDRLIRADADAKGVAFFSQKLWQQTRDSVTTDQLHRQFGKKPGLPYLLAPRPLRKTVARVVRDGSYAYWDPTAGEQGRAYWCGDPDSNPDEWDKRGRFAASPDVATEISDGDVKLGDQYVVYRNANALLTVHGDRIRPPEPDDYVCAESGCETVVEEEGDRCPEHAIVGTACQECGTVLAPSELESGLCPACREPDRWEQSLPMRSASRAFTELRNHALAAGSNTPGVGRLTLEIVGDDRLSKGSFVASQSPFQERAEHVTVRMEFSAGDGESRYDAEFTGGLDAFDRVDNQPDGFEQTDVSVRFRVDLPSPEAIDDDETDLLAELDGALGKTGVDVKLQGRGPTDIA